MHILIFYERFGGTHRECVEIVLLNDNSKVHVNDNDSLYVLQQQTTALRSVLVARAMLYVSEAMTYKLEPIILCYSSTTVSHLRSARAQSTRKT